MLDTLKANIKLCILPHIFAFVLTFAVFDVYKMTAPLPWGLGAAVLLAVTMAGCIYSNGKKRINELIFTLFVVLYAVYIYKLLDRCGYRAFMTWVYTAGSTEGGRGQELILFLAVPFLFGSMVFYFTRAMYRLFGLTLVSLIPFAIYISTIEEVSNVYIIAISLLNLAAYIEHKYSGAYIGDKTKLIRREGIFIFVVMMLAAAVPKENKAPYYNTFRSLFLMPNTYKEMGESYAGMSDMSGNADNYKNLEDRLLYNVFAESVVYLKRQNFDHYNYELNRWTPDELYSIDENCKNRDWTRWSAESTPAVLIDCLREAEYVSPGFLQKYGINLGNTCLTKNNQSTYMYIQSTNFAARYYPVPTDAIGMQQRNFDEQASVTLNGTFFSEYNDNPYTQYAVAYFDMDRYKEELIATGIANMTLEEAVAMHEELYDLLEKHYTGMIQLQKLARAEIYKDIYSEEPIPEDIQALADKITEGLTYDWEKAEAIERYFHTNGFKYDIEYNPNDDSPQYFLFKSKRGTCSDFATAYVLLARAAGLITRYAEGYVPEESFGEYAYTVRDLNSHAYPEVFIPNMGWLVYEPTVSSTFNLFGSWDNEFFESFALLDMDYRLVLNILYALGVFLLIAFAGKFIILSVAEGIFIIRLRYSRSPQMAYKRLISKYLKTNIPYVEGLTPKQVSVFLKNINVDADELIALVEKSAYKGDSISKEEGLRVVNLYKELKLAVKKQLKAQKRLKSGARSMHKAL